MIERAPWHAEHLRHNAAGGDRDVSLADVQAVFVGEEPDEADQVVIIVHRLSASHDHHIGNALPGISGSDKSDPASLKDVSFS